MKQIIKATAYNKRGRIIAVAYNNYNKTHPLQAYFAEKVGHHCRIYLHAELACILKASGKHIYHLHVERYGRDGRPLLAKPCPICQEAIKAFNIELVTFTKG